MFDLMSPCKDCPFRKDCGHRYQFRLGRLREIMTATAFVCHKTVDREVDLADVFGHGPSAPGWKEPGTEQQCAGLMAVLDRMDRPNQIMQVASRLGYLDLSKLDPRREAYENFTEVLIAHGHR